MSLISVVDEFPLFREREEKKRFLLVLGLLASRTVTLGKAALMFWVVCWRKIEKRVKRVN